MPAHRMRTVFAAPFVVTVACSSGVACEKYSDGYSFERLCAGTCAGA